MTVRSAPRTRTAGMVRPLLLLATCAALACGWWALARGVHFAGMILRYAAPLDGQEGMALWEAGMLRAGQNIYRSLVPDNFVSAPYPPIHPLLLALVGGNGGPLPFRNGRILSLIAALLAAACSLGAVRQITRSWLGGIAAAILLLSFAPLQIWALRIKPDVLALALTIGGLWLAAIGEGTGAGRWQRLSLVAAAIVFVLAHFTKQTMLAGPLAVVTVLALHDWRRAV